jgi:hypothetical protein
MAQNPALNYSYALCFTNSHGICNWPSNFQSSYTGQRENITFPDVVPPNTNLATLGFLATKPGKISTTGPSTTTNTIGVFVTVTPTVTPGPTVSPGTKSKSGLSIGAIAGIAVGAVVIILAILILALLFLRKKHRQKSNKEHLMLNQSLNADSHDLITEKEISPISYQIPTLNFASSGSPTSQTRHSALSPYDSIPSQPYNGTAASIPRRKATLSTATANSIPPPAAPSEAIAATIPISREVSAASSHLPPSRSISTTRSPTQPHNYEQYHDVPPYGHASPQVYQGGLQAPFLSETDSERGGSVALSDRDHTRLTEEEEERRIDAAIAESERLKTAQGR